MSDERFFDWREIAKECDRFLDAFNDHDATDTILGSILYDLRQSMEPK